MVRRKVVGLNYNYDENWIGGVYYIENLVHALNTLPDIEKPIVCIITSNKKRFRDLKKKTLYPYLKFQVFSGEKNFLFSYINRMLFKVLKVRLFSIEIYPLDAVFPFHDCAQFRLAKNKIYWIPDFQEHFVPNFFSEREIEERRKNQTIIQESSLNLVLSSNDAYGHLKLLYPKHKVKVYVLPFAVSHPVIHHVKIETLIEKYGLPEKYFICPNQFWRHKNQFTILHAVTHLKKRGINIVIAFTGKPFDYRHPDYFNELNRYVIDNNLEENIKFLGFIERTEQLQLMNYSIAIIQPSLFEGWSTVVEDAKSLNKPLIVSDIKVHREQLKESTAVFFNPLKEIELAECLNTFYNQNFLPPLFEKYNYKENIEEFGRNFVSILREQH